MDKSYEFVDYELCAHFNSLKGKRLAQQMPVIWGTMNHKVQTTCVCMSLPGSVYILAGSSVPLVYVQDELTMNLGEVLLSELFPKPQSTPVADIVSPPAS